MLKITKQKLKSIRMMIKDGFGLDLGQEHLFIFLAVKLFFRDL